MSVYDVFKKKIGALIETRTPNLLITNQSMREFHLVLCRILNDCGVTRQIKSHGTTMALHSRLKI